MYVPAALIVALLLFAGCATAPVAKPLTPTELQVIAQVVSHRLLAPKLNDATARLTVIHGLESAKTALETMQPMDLLKHLGDFLGPENKDISDLIVVLVKERVDLTLMPEIQGKAYVFAVLDGVQGGLE
jgi:hypothetical protein